MVNYRYVLASARDTSVAYQQRGAVVTSRVALLQAIGQSRLLSGALHHQLRHSARALLCSHRRAPQSLGYRKTRCSPSACRCVPEPLRTVKCW